MDTGRLDSIWIAPFATERPHAVERATAVARRGLEGDRYAKGLGTFSRVDSGNVRELTLVDAEAVDHLRRASGAELDPGDLRRNLVVSGLDLPTLIGAQLRIGSVRIEVTGTCPPCAHLDRLLALDSLGLLKGRGGLRARILEGGELVASAAVAISKPPRRLP